MNRGVVRGTDSIESSALPRVLLNSHAIGTAATMGVGTSPHPTSPTAKSGRFTAAATAMTASGRKSATAYQRHLTMRARTSTMPRLPWVKPAMTSAARNGPNESMGTGNSGFNALMIQPIHRALFLLTG
jgi:hypothetical protein